MMRISKAVKAICRAVLVLALVAPWGGPAAAQSLWVEVDLSEQRMTVTEGQDRMFEWPVSTARVGKCTPAGVYTPYLLKEEHYSSLYNNAPMPWSVFFFGNYAIHGTTQVDMLGTPASAGCVRLAPENAETLFRRIQDVGKSETRILIRE
ncbi:L,D-transpeptidase [Lutimaribacter sp. EGI FJ00015]|uniref:L,D-transpeptidase n=1 Tax=Lutimaribacter degradans TaxID=2945989 RepID=A0ACC5ZT92_9RHOB|nr:L,D-transpeptidase [Lutimaribacter sp. EGI FJ00013]MCM2561521.1 L,D-transpeptidase [Lutimaribacter sp. EGI FJ00013]MCO0612768.1 L,D-transpeptidase [Lutimaribacter sp. EGI FJ00015]MCO0635426.1 L,D-transpeptidase [Lutimaribacter sp. EGI FJ00014]